MSNDRLEKGVLVKFAGLGVGIMIGGPLGPIVFTPLGLNIPEGAAIGSFTGAILGYLAAAGLVSIDSLRRDRELQKAAEAVRAEAGLPQTITIKVKDAHVWLGGEVKNYSDRHRAEGLISKVPGVKAITNKIRVLRSAGQVTTSPEEIQKQIQQRLLRRAELEASGIRVRLDDARLVLEGTVSSWAEASQAEDVAWNIPGIAEVDNRLEIAA